MNPQHPCSLVKYADKENFISYKRHFLLQTAYIYINDMISYKDFLSHMKNTLNKDSF